MWERYMLCLKAVYSLVDLMLGFLFQATRVEAARRPRRRRQTHGEGLELHSLCW